MIDQVSIGLIGGGTVGGGVCQALLQKSALLASRLGVRLHLARVGVRDLGKARAVRIPAGLLTTDWRSVVSDPAIQVVVELVGGTSTAREVVTTALSLGKPVVTANKMLLSAHGPELFALADKFKANLYYEASVAGGIPIIKVLRESLVGNRILSLHGIVNGTCNYILTRMKLEGADLASVLSDAQRLGYAEAEASLDIDGHDAAHKIGILASLANGFWVHPDEIHTEGIRHLAALDLKFAAQLGYTIKLLGVIKCVNMRSASEKGRRPAATAKSRPCIQAAVYPALVPDTHVLASVNYAYNAIYVRGDIVGETLFYGRGAGQDPTASSVLSDLADATLDLKHGTLRRVPAFVHHDGETRVLPMTEVVSRYYVRLSVTDRPGVLAQIASILGKAKIGISSVIQPEGHEGESVPLILMIHDAPNQTMARALDRISKLNVVRGRPVMIRVEPF